jgi:hypothetical protein
MTSLRRKFFQDDAEACAECMVFKKLYLHQHDEDGIFAPGNIVADCYLFN